MPAFAADASAFLVARLENRCVGRELSYLTHAFATGDMDEFDAAPVASGGVTHWSCGAKRWLQGNVGCVVYGISGAGAAAAAQEGGTAAAADGGGAPPADAAELLCVWSFPYSGEDRIGVHLGPPGAFSSLTPVTLTTKYGAPELQTPSFSMAVLGEHAATASFGRHPAIFSVSTADAALSSLALPRAPLAPKASCFVLCELSNQLPNAALRLRASPFAAGQCQSAVPPFVGAGEVVCWAASTSANMAAIGRGNIGAAVYETVSSTSDGIIISPMELVVMWHLPYVGDPKVGCRIGSDLH